MELGGSLEPQQVVDAANKDATGLQRCALPFASSTKRARTINLQITVSNGEVTAGDLQSPASDAAKECIVDLAKTWKVAGSGTAMVLLKIQD